MKPKFTLALLLLLNFFNSNAQCNDADFSYTVDQNGLVTLTVAAVNPGPNYSLRDFWYFDVQNQPLNFETGSLEFNHLYWNNTNTFFHYYNKSGVFTVKHIVVDSSTNCKDSVTKVVNATYDVNCHLDFDILQNEYSNKLYTTDPIISYTGSGIKKIARIIDGIIDSINYFSVITLEAGVHEICFTLETNDGCTSSKCKSINVAASQNCPSMSFTAIASTDDHKKFTFTPSIQKSSIKYLWKFGDGYTSQTMLAQHTYYASANYKDSLITYDTLNYCSDTTIQTIIIQPLPSEACTASFTYNLDSSHILLTPSSNQAIINQTWYLYKNYPSAIDSLYETNGYPVQYNFKDTGYYYVCLKINTNTGCTISSCQVIVVENLSQKISGNLILPSYPNPATNNVKVNVDMDDAGKANVTVYNSFGTVVYKSEINTFKGKNTIAIPIQNLVEGQYFIDILQGGKRNKSIFQKL